MDKKALLVVSFGTTYRTTREKTIGAIEASLAEVFSDRHIAGAWTSSFIIKKVREKEGIIIDTPEEALKKLADSGYTDVIVQPTHLSDGFENRKLEEAVRKFSSSFDRIALGRPLLASEEDRMRAAGLITEICRGEDNEGKALMLMGHGSAKHPVRVYEQLQEVIDGEGIQNVFVGTVEGTPTFEDALVRLEASGCRYAVLAPLMIVAGDHAVNDMAGDEPDSWKNILSERGYETEIIMAGLGEYGQIREMFADHAAEAEII